MSFVRECKHDNRYDACIKITNPYRLSLQGKAYHDDHPRYQQVAGMRTGSDPGILPILPRRVTRRAQRNTSALAAALAGRTSASLAGCLEKRLSVSASRRAPRNGRNGAIPSHSPRLCSSCSNCCSPARSWPERMVDNELSSSLISLADTSGGGLEP